MTIKILVHLNHGSDKSYLLAFAKSVSPWELKALVEDPDPNRAIQGLMALASSHKTVPPRSRRKAQSQAAFVVSQNGYTMERLG